MAMQLAEGEVQASFVLTMGDNFYDCSKREAFAREFEILKREMMEVVPLPWYFILGNHDVKGTGAELHTKEFHAKEGACNGAANARFSGTHGSWRFRCPRSFYRVADDWNLMPAVPPWDLGLLDLLVISTNKKKTPLNFLGLQHGQLSDDAASWADQKAWLRTHLSYSHARWKIVAGHHPIELIPQSFLEHAIPGVYFLTSGFMKGHHTSRRAHTGMRDVVVQGKADMYLSGHQHLLAHLVRKGGRRTWLGGAGPGDGALDYAIVGSSSKLEQDVDDFEDPSEKPPPKSLDSSWKERKVEKVKQKMSSMWYTEQVGYAVVEVTASTFSCRFYTVLGSGERSLVHTLTKSKPAGAPDPAKK